MKKIINPFVLLIVAITILSIQQKDNILFVDSARYADMARNLLQTNKFVTKFTFPTNATLVHDGWLTNQQPVHILSIAFFFNFFGINDKSVIYESSAFFVLSVLLTYLLTKKLFSKKVAFIVSLFYIFTPELLNYAIDGASEPIFIFELLLISYLIVLNKNWSIVFAGIVTALSIFTKLQALLFVPIFIVWVLLLFKNDLSKVILFIIGPLIGVTLNHLGILFSHYKVGLPSYLVFQQSTLFPGDNIARSGKTSQVDLFFIFKNLNVFLSKIFYNLYNFYKSVFTFTNLLPAWTSPFIVVTYLLSSSKFLEKEEKEIRIFRFIVLLMVIGPFILAAATSPHIRYVHLTIPFIIIISVDFVQNLLSKLGFTEKKISIILASTLILFMVIPMLGNRFLDSRFETKTYNMDKPYAHKILGQKLGELTKDDGIIVTNLDSWGSWYGERRTILIPLDINELEKLDNKITVDAIFLTDYQKDNEDHPLKGDWDLMYNIQNADNKFIENNFILQKSGEIFENEIYENKKFSYKYWSRINEK